MCIIYIQNVMLVSLSSIIFKSTVFDRLAPDLAHVTHIFWDQVRVLQRVTAVIIC